MLFTDSSLPELMFRALRIARNANFIMTLWFLLPIRIPGLGLSDGFLIWHLLLSKNIDEHFEITRAYFEKNIKSD